MHLILIATLLSAAPHVDPQAEFLRGQFALSVKRWDVATAAFESAVRITPGFALALNGLGIARFRAGHRAEGVEDFKAALAADPTLAVAWLNLGYASRLEGQFVAAIAAYRRYRVLAPRDPDALYGLGESYRLAGRTDEALAAFAGYLKLETRPSEDRWVVKARALIVTLRAKPSPAAERTLANASR